MNSNKVLIITGMDRSGTSWVASSLQDSGVFMGEHLFEANRGNPLGYFEDEEVLALHIRLLKTANLEGLHMYASVDPHSTEIVISEEDVREALNLINRRRGYSLWGFKDPRATLFLDFWQRLIPDVKVICLYRFPLETCLSLFSRGDGFVHLGDVFRAFQHRMGQALAFKQTHPQHMLLCNIHQVVAAPEQFEQLMTRQLGLDLSDLTKNLRQRFSSEVFSEVFPSHETLVKFHRYFPETAALYAKIEITADLPNYDDFEQSSLAKARRQAETEPDPVEPSELERRREDFFTTFIEDSLAIATTKRKVIESFLESIKIKGGIQYELARLHQQIADLSQERDILQGEISDHERFLQSQDLVTRHFIQVTFKNIHDIFRNPAQIKEKLRRWHRARVKREPVSFDENQVG